MALPAMFVDVGGCRYHRSLDRRGFRYRHPSGRSGYVGRLRSWLIVRTGIGRP